MIFLYESKVFLQHIKTLKIVIEIVKENRRWKVAIKQAQLGWYQIIFIYF
jgi:hypothetical protein